MITIISYISATISIYILCATTLCYIFFMNYIKKKYGTYFENRQRTISSKYIRDDVLKGILEDAKIITDTNDELARGAKIRQQTISK